MKIELSEQEAELIADMLAACELPMARGYADLIRAQVAEEKTKSNAASKRCSNCGKRFVCDETLNMDFSQMDDSRCDSWVEGGSK